MAKCEESNIRWVVSHIWVVSHWCHSLSGGSSWSNSSVASVHSEVNEGNACGVYLRVCVCVCMCAHVSQS